MLLKAKQQDQFNDKDMGKYSVCSAKKYHVMSVVTFIIHELWYPLFQLHIHCLPLPPLGIDCALRSGLISSSSPLPAAHLSSSFGPDCWPKSSGTRSLTAASHLPPPELRATVWLEIRVVCFIQDGKIMKLVFGKGLCNIISLQLRYLRRFMKRRYGMSPVSLSMRHTIKINEGR